MSTTTPSAASRGTRRGGAPSKAPRAPRPHVWLQPAESWTLQELDAEIRRFVEHIALTKDEKAARDVAVALVSDACSQALPRSTVTVVGSFAFDLALPTSDVDVCIQGTEGDPAVALAALQDALEAQAQTDDMELILARIPVLKVSFKSGVQVDINASPSQSAVDTITRLRHFLHQHPQARSVILLVKSLLRQWGLSNVFRGGLSSTSVYLLIERFFTLRETGGTVDLPRLMSAGGCVADLPLNASSPCLTPRSESSWGPTASEESASSVDRSTLAASLFVDFLEHCGSEWYMYGFKLIDPSDPSNEVSRGTKRVLEIQALMMHARSSLLAVTKGVRPIGAPLSQLSAILADPRATCRGQSLSIRVGNKIVRN